MKGFKKFNTKSVIATGTAVLVAGAGSAVADWLLAKYDVNPAEYQDYTNIGKVVLGAIGGSMITNQIAKSAFDGIATVGAANLVTGFLPNGATTGSETTSIETTSTETPSGLPKGTIGRVKMGNKAFKRGVRGVAGADFMQA